MQPATEASLTHARSWEGDGAEVHHLCYRGFAAATHAHDVAQAIIPLAGRMHVAAAGRSHVLAPEGAVWIPAGLPHAFVHVDGQVDFLALETPDAFDEVRVAHAPNVRLLAQAIANELDQPGPQADDVVRACLGLLRGYLARPRTERAQASSPEVALVIEAVLAGYAAELRVPDLAARVGLSPRQLERRFQEELGRTPKRFVMEVRVGVAEQLLATTRRSVAQIALDVGFQTPSHFADTFKALRGRTPTSLRGVH